MNPTPGRVLSIRPGRPEPDTVLDVAREAGWFTDIVNEIFTPGTGGLADLWT